MIHPEDIGDFQYKQRKEDRLTEKPEEELDEYLAMIDAQEEENGELDEEWENFLRKEAA